MYNRYSMEIRDDDWVPAGGRPEPPRSAPPPGPPPVPPPPPRPGGGGDILSRLLSRLRPDRLETDDLLLLGIAFLLLRESGDQDLFLIVAALFLLGD